MRAMSLKLCEKCGLVTRVVLTAGFNMAQVALGRFFDLLILPIHFVDQDQGVGTKGQQFTDCKKC